MRIERCVVLALLGAFGCGRSSLVHPSDVGDAGPTSDAEVAPADGPGPDAGLDAATGPWLRRLSGEGPSGSLARFDDDGNVIIAGSGNLTSYAPDGTFRWARSLWGAQIRSAAVVGDRIVVGGQYGRAIDLGDGALSAPAPYRGRLFVATYTTDGELAWSRELGEILLSGSVSVDLDEEGNVYVGGSVRGVVDFGGGRIGNDDHEFARIFLASLTRDGGHRWSSGFDRGFRYDEPTIVVGNGGVYLTGLFAGPTSFGGETFVTSSWSQPFIASFTTGGSHRWSRAVDEAVTLRGDRDGRVLADGAVPEELVDDGARRVDLEGFAGFDAAGNAYSQDGDTGIRSHRPDGTLRWQRVFDRIDGAEVERLQVSVDGAGNVVALGAFEGDVDVFEGDADGIIRGTGRFIASYTSTGAPRWVRRHSSPWFRRVHDVASDADGHVYVLGTYSGEADLGAGPRATREESELYLASFAPDGSARWAHTFGAAGPPYLEHDIVVDARGVTIAGVFAGSLELGGDPITSSRGVYVARFTTDGRHRWSHGLGSTYARTVSLAVDRTGVAHVVHDGAVERFDDEGATLGSIPLPSGGDVSVDDEGRILLAVVHSSPVDLGGGPLDVPEPTTTAPVPYVPHRGRLGVAVASLTPSGEHRWSTSLELPGESGLVDIAHDGDGNVVVLARGRDQCSFDCRPVAYALTVVASLSTSGELRWSHRLPGVGGRDIGPDLTLDERGNVWVTGNYLGPLELDRALPEPDVTDALVVAFTPSGALLGSRAFGGPFGNAEGLGIAAGPEGAVYVVGTFSGMLDAGFARRMSESGLDTFLARFDPALE